jgi:hypothetical protein
MKGSFNFLNDCFRILNDWNKILKQSFIFTKENLLKINPRSLRFLLWLTNGNKQVTFLLPFH